LQKLLIEGGHPLNGVINVQGAKNAALPVMAAAILLKSQTLELENVPNLHDVNTMAELLRELGAEVTFAKGEVKIDVPEELNWNTPATLVRKMRASSLVLGPLAARCGKVMLPLPGGCAIGSRPIDFHLKALKEMGAEISLKDGAVYAETDGRLKGANITFDFPSVGATENIMMAAALADGYTNIENAACEPEIVNLADVLRGMGVPVTGDGTPSVRILGQRFLNSSKSAVVADRIEAFTYLVAGVISRGKVTVKGIAPQLLSSALQKLEEAGAKLTLEPDSITAEYAGKILPVTIKTMPHPGFATDAQPQMMALLTLADGTSRIHEGIFESRLMHVPEFNKAGAKIAIQDNTAIVNGEEKIFGAEMFATDLRAGAAMILMGLAAEGTTKVGNLGHVWRGYDDIVGKLQSLGAKISLIDEE